MIPEKIKILFVCVENSCRSQMAEGLARHFWGEKVEAYSAGSRPSGVVNHLAIKVMADLDIDISQQRSKGFAALPHNSFDYVVTLGCNDFCPFFPAKQALTWQIPDPKGGGVEQFSAVREQLREQIDQLLTSA